MATAEAPQEQFDDLEQQRTTDVLGMWIFLATELLLFGGLFTSYAVLRWHDVDVFNKASHHLDLMLGSVNTAIILTSGLTMAISERLARAQRQRGTLTFLLATIFLGVIFLCLKGYEWHTEAMEGLSPILGLPFVFPDGPDGPARRFFSCYYALTGLHALHMTVGLGILSVVAVLVARWRRPGRIARQVRISGLYWAFVDIAWIFVYTSLYLLRS